MQNWAENVLKEMEQRLSGTREKDMRFFRIDELRRNIKRIDNYTPDCDICRNLKNETEIVLAHVNEAVNVPGSHRRELDRLMARLARHMMKVHSFYPPYYFNYLYTTYGLFAGLVVAMLVFFLFLFKYSELIAAIFFVAGLLIGQILGGKKDRRIRSDQKLM